VSELLAHGMGVGRRVAVGPGRRCQRRVEYRAIASGEVIVIPAADSELLIYLDRVAGIVCESGSMSAHLVQLAIEFDVPYLRSEAACAEFEDGELLRLDPTMGRLWRP
jgi:phosphohistidine swiveling domain-containing protein